MKNNVILTRRELRKLIREEYMKGLPEFLLRQATDDYVSNIKQHITKYIMTYKSENVTQRNEALKSLDEVTTDLADEIQTMLEDKLFTFIGSV